jgi:CRP/FNR family transcriptional regulator, cyclic AMP receptor protein
MMAIEDIRNFDLFSGLNEEELTEVAELCKRRIYEPNSVIFDLDTLSDEIFIVESDNDVIRIEIPLGHGAGKVIIHTLTRGETFGWAALGSNHVKTAVVRCLDRVSVIAINGNSLIQLMDRNNHLGYIIMRNLSEVIALRLAYTTVAFRHEILKNKVKPLSIRPSAFSAL